MKVSKYKIRCSYIVMGLGQFLYGQRIKGLLYMSVLAVYVWYLIDFGFADIIGFFTLGTTEGDPWLGIAGDDSIIMLLKGILSFLILISVIILYLSNIKDIKNTEKLLDQGKPIPGFFPKFCVTP